MGFSYELIALASAGIEFALSGPLGEAPAPMMADIITRPGGSIEVSVLGSTGFALCESE
jgi:hypothetical protein